jgi:hypothetical protein
MTVQEIIAKLLEIGREIESLSVLEYKKNNRLADKSFRLIKMLRKDLELAKVVYEELLVADCAVTRVNAASECLSLGIYIDEAVRVLTEIANRPDIGIKSFEAELTLRVWRGEVPGKTL